MFEDRRTRKGFVKKVMGLVLLQLLVTVGASALFRYWDSLLVSHNSALLTRCRAFCCDLASMTYCITGDGPFWNGYVLFAHCNILCEQSAKALYVGEALHIVFPGVLHPLLQ